MRIKKAVNKLCKELKKDSEYYAGWQANIAMAIFDELCRQRKEKDFRRLSKNELHEACNQGAVNFLNLLCRGDE